MRMELPVPISPVPLAPAAPSNTPSITAILERGRSRIHRCLGQVRQAHQVANPGRLREAFLFLSLELRRHMDFEEQMLATPEARPPWGPGSLQEIYLYHVELQNILEEIRDVLNEGQEDHPPVAFVLQRRLEELEDVLAEYAGFTSQLQEASQTGAKCPAH